MRQDMGRGRTKAVVVETRKRRPVRPEDEKPHRRWLRPSSQQARRHACARRPCSSPSQPARRNHSTPQPRPQDNRPRVGVVLNQLSAGEIDARRRALAEAQIRDAEDAKRRAAEEARRQVEEAARLKREQEEAARLAAEEAARTPAEREAEKVAVEAAQAAEAEAALAAAAVAARRAEQARPQSTTKVATRRRSAGSRYPRGRKVDAEEDDEPSGPWQCRAGSRQGRASGAGKGPCPSEDRRRAPPGKLTLTAALDDDGNPRGRSLSAMRRRQEKFRRSQMQETREKVMREVILPETITIQELSQRMSERSVDVIKFLMKEGQMMKPGDIIDADLAELIAGRIRPYRQARCRNPTSKQGIFNVYGRRWRTGFASAGRHHHGSRRPRQDLAARRHPQCQCGVRAKPVASPSISVPIRSSRTATRSPSSTRPATRPLPPCVPVVRRQPTSPSWWLRPTTA